RPSLAAPRRAGKREALPERCLSDPKRTPSLRPPLVFERHHGSTPSRLEGAEAPNAPRRTTKVSRGAEGPTVDAPRDVGDGEVREGGQYERGQRLDCATHWAPLPSDRAMRFSSLDVWQSNPRLKDESSPSSLSKAKSRPKFTSAGIAKPEERNCRSASRRGA